MPTPDETPGASSGLSFFIIACTLLVVGVGSGIATTFIPVIARDFGLSYGTLGLAIAISLFFLILCLALGGRLRALIGDKPLLLTATSIFAVGALLEGLAPDFSVWLVSRPLQGAATGCLLCIGLGFAADNARRRWRADALGVLLALYFLGAGLGPALGGYYYESYGWRGLCYMVAGSGLLLAVLQAAFVKPVKRTEIESIFD
ncbi:MFS transporter [Labrys neptuniae]